MEQIVVNKKDDVVIKMLHYFVTEENYKPIILNGVKNEIWLENFDKDLKLIRININYIHNEEQFNSDLWKADIIRKNIAKKTFSLKTQMLNILVDTNDDLEVNGMKNIETLKVKKVGDVKKNKVLNDFFPSIKDKLISKAGSIEDIMKLSTELNEKTIKEEQKMEKIFKKKTPMMTEILIGINVAIFVAMFIIGVVKPEMYNVITYYTANNYKLIQSEGILGLYRLILSLFVHVNIFHILFNMYALYVVGSQVERYYGRAKFLIIYFVSGIVASLFSNVFMASSSISVGSTGALFGLFGALGYFSYNYKAILGGFLKSSIIPIIIINLFLGLYISGLDALAQVGGLIGGVFISIYMGASGKERKSSSINFLITLILLAIFMTYMIFVR